MHHPHLYLYLILSVAMAGCTAEFPEDLQDFGPSLVEDLGPEYTDGDLDAGQADLGTPDALVRPDGDLVDGDVEDEGPDADRPDLDLPDAGCEPFEELCNGLDDDCDGETDEGLGLGNLCMLGVGECARRGVLVCGDQLLDVVCDASLGEPEAERCNNLDDDCDGEADEDFPTLGAPCVEGAGECRRAGVWRCGLDGALSCDAPAAAPRDELCNGLDDDCDGATDEGLGFGEPCSVGVGECARDGALTCDEEGGVLCTASASPPQVELCNGLDDDCDGATDERFPELGDACSAGLGLCRRQGLWRCDDLGGTTCDARPGQPIGESCNEIDDDCDGSIDEGLGVGLTCTVGVGECSRAGAQACDGLGGVECDVEPGLPGLEICNALDDDCDGAADEDFLDLGRPCAAGVGRCRVEGIWRCDERNEVSCDARPELPVAEQCNTLDDDCDGRVDEELGLAQVCAAGLGQCRRPGFTVCDGAGGVICGAEPGAPRAETCNGIDDDCDGAIDEDFPTLGTPCVEGVGQCLTAGLWRCTPDGGTACGATPGEPRPEVCNRLDDDCDGQADEGIGLGELCEIGVGECRRQGVQICGEQPEVVCSALPGEPVDEICNNLDDDCDGGFDEDIPTLGDPCVVGVGACTRQGVNSCDVFGGVACGASPGLPADELCNGVDDDCDGETDEGICGPYIARQCRVWLAQADRNDGPDEPSLTFGDCPGADADTGGDTRCTSTRGDARFRVLDLQGDLNRDDRLAVAFTCDDDNRPDLAAWIESRCKVYLGHADDNLGVNNTPTWGPCPAADVGVEDGLRCTSSGGDRQFRVMQLVGDVNGDDDLAIAFICRDDVDPSRAAEMAAAVEVFITWSASTLALDGSPTWSECPAEVRDNTGNERCVSSRGDQLFHMIDLSGDIKGNDQLGVGLFSRQ